MCNVSYNPLCSFLLLLLLLLFPSVKIQKVVRGHLSRKNTMERKRERIPTIESTQESYTISGPPRMSNTWIEKQQLQQQDTSSSSSTSPSSSGGGGDLGDLNTTTPPPLGKNSESDLQIGEIELIEEGETRLSKTADYISKRKSSDILFSSSNRNKIVPEGVDESSSIVTTTPKTLKKDSKEISMSATTTGKKFKSKRATLLDRAMEFFGNKNQSGSIAKWANKADHIVRVLF
jgi:type II secretory pathway pseudopilin PulG